MRLRSAIIPVVEMQKGGRAVDNVLTIAEERLNLFAHMANSACGLSLWCFGMKKQLYTCTCPAEKEFRLFLDLGQCLDYAIAHGPESHAPILMSDPIGMLWVAECVWHGDDASYLVILGPVFDAAASLQTLQNCLRGMNLSVSLTATIMEKIGTSSDFAFIYAASIYQNAALGSL